MCFDWRALLTFVFDATYESMSDKCEWGDMYFSFCLDSSMVWHTAWHWLGWRTGHVEGTVGGIRVCLDPQGLWITCMRGHNKRKVWKVESRKKLWRAYTILKTFGINIVDTSGTITCFWTRILSIVTWGQLVTSQRGSKREQPERWGRKQNHEEAATAIEPREWKGTPNPERSSIDWVIQNMLLMGNSPNTLTSPWGQDMHGNPCSQ